jgi:hypothetical protein
MGPPSPGYVLVWDVVPFDAGWVLGPGLATFAVCALLLLLSSRARAGRRILRASAAVLTLLAVWWTLGGLGAWRMGIGRLREGTADFVEGTLQATVPAPEGGTLDFRVAGQRFHASRDGFVPALHATRWPTVPLAAGQRVRVWFFGADVLRLELAEGQ